LSVGLGTSRVGGVLVREGLAVSVLFPRVGDSLGVDVASRSLAIGGRVVVGRIWALFAVGLRFRDLIVYADLDSLQLCQVVEVERLGIHEGSAGVPTEGEGRNLAVLRVHLSHRKSSGVGVLAAFSCTAFCAVLSLLEIPLGGGL